MHYSFHSTPTCTFKSRTESTPRPIQLSLSSTRRAPSPDLQIIKYKSLFTEPQQLPKLLKKEIFTINLKPIPDLDLTK